MYYIFLTCFWSFGFSTVIVTLRKTRSGTKLDQILMVTVSEAMTMPLCNNLNAIPKILYELSFSMFHIQIIIKERVSPIHLSPTCS